MKLGDAIKELRKSKKLNQQQVSSCCNISQTYLSQIENNKKLPNFGTIDRISKCLEIPIPVLLFKAITENDVRDDKKSLYEIMKPTIDKFIDEIFIVRET